MFQLTRVEAEALRSQFVISNDGRGGRRYAPYVFTEQGVAMLSGVLRSDRAIAVNIEIMRAFVELRRIAGSFQELQTHLDQLELDIGARLSGPRAGGRNGSASRGWRPQSPAASRSSRSARSRVRPAACFIAFRSSTEQTATVVPRISASVARERSSS